MKAMSLRISMQTLSPWPDAKPLQSAGDARGAIGDLGVAAPALAADDAEEKRMTLIIVFSIFVELESFVVIAGAIAKHRLRLACIREDVDHRDSPG